MFEGIFNDYNTWEGRKFDAELSDNPIINILTYFLVNAYHKKQHLSRIIYDGDARYIYLNNRDKGEEYALRADIMVSFFTPYKYAIKCATGKVYNKTVEDLKELISKVNQPEYKRVNDKFLKLAQLYITRGNILLLPDYGPDGRMNFNKYSCSEDRIDKFLFECFESGYLFKYFKNNTEILEKWIKEEKLDICFDKTIKVATIRPISNNKKYFEMKDDEIFSFIDEVIKIIEYRNINL